ncbi:MAG: hypothetical protein K9K75_06275 [Deltaproteobacteria bacterium]|nr:hypothetical protein [Deltaproteobacteria bacterium]
MATFFTLGAQEKLKDNKLLKLALLINWEALRKHLHGIHRNDTAPSLGGQRPYDPRC